MRSYRVECIDPRDDTCINIESVKADLFMISDDNIAVTFYVEKEVLSIACNVIFCIISQVL